MRDIGLGGEDFVVDCDGHVIEPDSIWRQYLPTQFHERAPRRIVDDDGFERVLIEGKLHRRGANRHGEGPRKKHLLAGAFDPHARILDMDRDGIDAAVLFPTIAAICFPSVEDPAFALELCRAYNDWISDFCKTAPERLRAVALVPLHQDTPAAVSELRRAVELKGLCGVALRPNPISGRALHHSDFDPFWTEAERLGIPICLHEGTSALVEAAGCDRFDNYMVRHFLSHPMEQMLSWTSFILGGVLPRHPRLSVAFLEAGAGWVPYFMDRADEHYRIMSHLVKTDVPRPPGEYFREQCFVACEPDEVTLPGTVEILGADNLLFSSDYPHFNGTFPGSTESLKNNLKLSAEVRAKIFGQNAMRLYARSFQSCPLKWAITR